MSVLSFEQYDVAMSLITPRSKCVTRCILQAQTPAGARCQHNRPGSAFPDRVCWLLHLVPTLTARADCFVYGNRQVFPECLPWSCPSVARLQRPHQLTGEKTGESISITDDQLIFDLGAYAPASFILE